MRINCTKVARLALLSLLCAALLAQAAEPLAGRWLLARQEVGGQKTEIDKLMLRIVPKGQTLEFDYSVPVNNIQFVSLKFAAKPDGSDADVTNGAGKKMGTVKITKAGPSQYKILLQGQNKPAVNGTMTVSADGKTLTSESESMQPGQTAVTRMVQVFSRQ